MNLRSPGILSGQLKETQTTEYRGLQFVGGQYCQGSGRDQWQRHLRLPPSQVQVLTLSNPDASNVTGRYLYYYVKVVSDRFYIPFYHDVNSQDQRRLGVRLKIDFE